MENRPRSSSRLSDPASLLRLLEEEFPDISEYCDLFVEFRRQQTYDRTFSVKLVDVARDEEVNWSMRRVAVLMLEHQVLKLHSDDLLEFKHLFESLNLKATNGRVVNSVLREGYSSTELCKFIEEFQRKLARLNRVHEKIRGSKTSESAWREFIKVSHDDCKLSLARYLFTPDEVIAEILDRLQITDGVRDLDPNEPR